MCTVVVRHALGEPTRVLALRDELVGRDFDDPGTWWPEQPDVIGGRDRTAGGSWCVTSVSSGVTALVLNRPERRTALPGAPSRGVLPLLGVAHGEQWQDHVDVSGMASFNLVLATPDALLLWVFDGTAVRRTDLGAGTRMVTSGGAEDGKADRYLSRFDREGWLDVVQGETAADDPAALVVRHEADGRVFASVFGQLITARPGGLELAYSRTPTAGDWLEKRWP
jgi:uncharacterized protein with NRDE domain